MLFVAACAAAGLAVAVAVGATPLRAVLAEDLFWRAGATAAFVLPGEKGTEPYGTQRYGAGTQRYGAARRAQARASTREDRRARRVAPGKRGELRIVRGRGGIVGRGPLVRFVVEIEGRVPVDTTAFARTIDRVLADTRGWSATRSFQRVDSAPFDLRVALASPTLTDRLCLPLRTNGIFSCAAESRAVLNARRWREGARPYGSDVARYRIYMINHEIGHVLGLGHAACPTSGVKAPVMMQQTKGVAPCRPNPWPLRSERQ